jgi:hypothetical protein
VVEATVQKTGECEGNKKVLTIGQAACARDMDHTVGN